METTAQVYVAHLCLTYDDVEYAELSTGPYDDGHVEHYSQQHSSGLGLRARLVAYRAIRIFRHGPGWVGGPRQVNMMNSSLLSLISLVGSATTPMFIRVVEGLG